MNEATILKIWKGFTPEQRNMPFVEFRKEMNALSDPVQMQKDLSEIQLRKARQRSNQIRIDKAKENE